MRMVQQNKPLSDGAFSQLRGLVGKKVNTKKYIHDALVELMAHEVGHTLGLRHNFKASTLHPADLLQDKKLTKKQGITSSVMDYIPVNISARGPGAGPVFPDHPRAIRPLGDRVRLHADGCGRSG